TDVSVGPELRLTFADDRFEWQTAAGDLVRVHWYEGSASFGAGALRIGEDAVRAVSELLGVTESDPIDFYVYADKAAFYDALGPRTGENVGGAHIPGTRLMFALIPPDLIGDSEVRRIVPHELTHLVFETAAGNPYHFPPLWLNEGLAVYLSQGYDTSDRRMVEAAARGGTLIPLDGLTGQFPSAERFYLAYAESVSALDYLVRTHGTDALVSLIRSYAQGRTDDEAFSAALGVDLSAFGAAWLEDLGATAPTRYGPQPAPEGPIPSAWLGEAEAPTPPAASNGAAVGSAGAPAAAGTGTPAADGGGGSLVLLLVVAGLGVATVAGVWFARRRRDRESAG
ncbi:MAG: peptidase MA family metallohydrolase, partial [Candidatus Limnocylindrales bacterium]|nr:peptidase MA family metallohydrolase [Candidatus Limnocylindrales bacterium]